MMTAVRVVIGPEQRMTQIAALAAHPRNYNRHSAGQVADLARSLTRFGQRKPVVTWRGVILAGHGLVEAARSLGWTEIWTAEAPEEWTEAEALAFVAADNELARAADPDVDALAALVAEVGDVDAELARLAAGGEEALKRLLASIQQPAGDDPGAQMDKAEELRVKWGVETGQLWAMGEHRLICGDCTDAAVVARVMDGEQPDIVLTDPPYSSGGFQEAGRRSGSIGTRQNAKIAADQLSTRGYLSLIGQVISLINADVLYMFTDWRMWAWTCDVAEQKNYPVRNMLVWDKGQMGMGFPWRSTHELIMFAKRTPAKMLDGKRGNVLRFDRTGNENHPTEKPTELLTSILENTEGAIVYDPFLGSGTTLIACERLGRRARCVEIEPGYVAVALERWSVMTGRTPVLLDGGVDG